MNTGRAAVSNPRGIERSDMAKKGSTAGKRSGRKRRGSGEDMTGAKADQVEVRTGSLIKPVELSEKDINHHFTAIKNATESKDTYVGKLRNAKKAADQSHPGLAAEIEKQMRAERKDDMTAVAGQLSLQAAVMRARGSTLQLTIFDTLAGDQMDLIYRRYYKDGKEAKPLANEYPVGSDLAAQAARAWRHGQAANMGLTPEKADEAVGNDDSVTIHNLPPPPDMTVAEQPTQH